MNLKYRGKPLDVFAKIITKLYNNLCGIADTLRYLPNDTLARVTETRSWV
ncbi:MAG: hypothetical protein ACI8ZX_003151 [Planctomycetota bacterium]|jgi:hypothetical protein